MNRSARRRRRRNRRRSAHRAWFAAITAAVLLALGLFALSRDRADAEVFVDEPGTPRLEVDRKIIDLGDVPPGQWVTASFTITNAGDGRLRFVSAPWVKAVAGC